MTDHGFNERQNKIRTLIAWLDQQLNARHISEWMRRCPDLADEWWKKWDEFESELSGFLSGDVPVAIIREMALLLISEVKE